jgi:deoxyribodipyrimidine photo-lyase
MSSLIPEARRRVLRDEDIRPDGEFVLYWMVASRRLRSNYAVERAAGVATDVGKPLLIFEPLRVDYDWASDRIHAFILQGMADNAQALAGSGVGYFPYVEPKSGAGSGLLEALAGRACVVVTDDYPASFLPRMQQAAAGRIPVRMESVDSNGLLPLSAAGRSFATALAFRRHLHRVLPDDLGEAPAANPLRRLDVPDFQGVPDQILARWPTASEEMLTGAPSALAALPIDHDVPPVERLGGSRAAHERLQRFVDERLSRYAEERNEPDVEVTSGLSAYLHFGHIGAHEVWSSLVKRERWTPAGLARDRRGRRDGWGMSKNGTSFADEFVTWRELGFHTCAYEDDYARFSSVPDWARATLAEHEADPRKWLYTREQLETAQTHDELWNAAQNQLRREGVIHNYLRMLWGKKILEWSNTPQGAFRRAVHLNNKYAIDGRDPNSYSGISWVFGKYDRPWGPERPIFGKVRYMTSASTRRKFSVQEYVDRFASGS